MSATERAPGGGYCIPLPKLNPDAFDEFEYEFALVAAERGLGAYSARVAEMTGDTHVAAADEDGQVTITTINAKKRQLSAMLLSCVDASIRGRIRGVASDMGDPDKIYIRIEDICLGAVAAERGIDIQEAFRAMGLPEGDVNDTSINTAFRAAETLLARAKACEAAEKKAFDAAQTQAGTTETYRCDYPVTEAMIVTKLADLFVKRDLAMGVFRKSWRNIRSLTTFRDEILRDARQLPAPTRTPRTFVADTGANMSKMAATTKALEQQVVALRTTMSSAGPASAPAAPAAPAAPPPGNGSPRHAYSVLQNRAQPPDTVRSWRWCEHHGSWSTTHDTAGCNRRQD